MRLDELLKLSEKVIKYFANEWQKTPYCWLQEIDIQVEIVHLFQQLLPEDQKYIQAIHGHEPHLKNRFNRVTCEPDVIITPSHHAIHPDIVIWGNSTDDNIRINEGYWPIFITFEIKSSFDDPATGEDDDTERLLKLLSNGRTQAAIQLIFIQKSSKVPMQITTVASNENRNLIIYRIYLPVASTE